MRLLTDTCSALKLAALGISIFQKGTLPSGDLILHPALFRETKKWKPARKALYKTEFSILAQVKAEPNLRSSGHDLDVQVEIVQLTAEVLGKTIGKVDREKLGTVLLHDDIELVTNDLSMQAVAEELDVTTYTAESIICEAVSAGIISLPDAQAALNQWKKNGDNINEADRPALLQIGLKAH